MLLSFHERNNVTTPDTFDKHSYLGCIISSGSPGTSTYCQLLIRPKSRRFSVKVKHLQFTLTIKLQLLLVPDMGILIFNNLSHHMELVIGTQLYAYLKRKSCKLNIWII